MTGGPLCVIRLLYMQGDNQSLSDEFLEKRFANTV